MYSWVKKYRVVVDTGIDVMERESIDTLCNAKLQTLVIMETGGKFKGEKGSKQNTFDYSKWESLTKEGRIHQLEEKLQDEPPHMHLGEPVSYKGDSYTILMDTPFMDKQDLKEMYASLGFQNTESVEFSETFDPEMKNDNVQIKGVTFLTPVVWNMTFDDIVYKTPSNVIGVIKMWGFGGMGSARNPFKAYEAALQHLVAKTTLNTIASSIESPVVVLYFDGDDAFNDDNEDAFSHAVFAPFVAHQLKKLLGGHVKVACMIVKTGKGRKDDPENGKMNEKVKEKLMTVLPGHYKLNTEDTSGKNSWPYFFDTIEGIRVFDAYQIAVADTLDNNGSEAKCEALLEFSGISPSPAPRFVLIVGGNTDAGGADSMIEYRKETSQSLDMFDAVVQIPLSHLKA